MQPRGFSTRTRLGNSRTSVPKYSKASILMIASNSSAWKGSRWTSPLTAVTRPHRLQVAPQFGFVDPQIERDDVDVAFARKKDRGRALPTAEVQDLAPTMEVEIAEQILELPQRMRTHVEAQDPRWIVVSGQRVPVRLRQVGEVHDSQHGGHGDRRTRRHQSTARAEPSRPSAPVQPVCPTLQRDTSTVSKADPSSVGGLCLRWALR